ncbi:indolepyruvate ferredoxin oxidoreductase family protein [Polycladidibacter hongkongensis]|uniref:indolepyruvate ferredoxin oxidoreductase family protein n=1 Tax=Polycladidibacter hongkongensis TaxID=1647556 RepID=UPI000829D025|nr:indolepyruvate ferredoxin oxidoreductase family protein [Pseudovibrio hongkongensis]
MTAVLRSVQLGDKYSKEQDGIYISGIQALVRIALERSRLDSEIGLKTGGFVSGYRGSPLGGFDSELARCENILAPLNIHFQPGLNEELGATAVWGTQKVRQHGKGSSFDGVFGMWYGKAPGVDRAGDVLKQANASGTDRNGGVLALAGDDHLAKSSILPAQSEFFFQHAEMPVFNPADIQDVLDHGQHGLEMSRYCGLWSGLICLADTMDASATVHVGQGRRVFLHPVEEDPRRSAELNRVLLLGNRLETERLLRDIRLPAAQAYVRANGLDRVAFGASKPRLGLVASGKAFRDVCQALELCGINDARARELGLSVFKVAMPYPLEPTAISGFARGLEKLMVVEHKRAFIEPQIKDIAYGWAPEQRPQIWGKKAPNGEVVLSDVLELSIAEIIQALRAFLPEDMQGAQMRAVSRQMTQQQMWAQGHGESGVRMPYFCSGCPHNSSTVIPEGARAMPGIGCHAMSEINGRTTDGQVAMGGEGVLWVGQAPFAKDKHVYANMGDGTYFHSGILAIRQAVAANVSMTYKVLYNDAVAMTGGQPIDGTLSVPDLLAQIKAEGVREVALLSETPELYGDAVRLPKGIKARHRDDLMQVQEELARGAGVSVIVYDQTCASEKRRRRKRGLMDDPDLRLFVNERVCEGCGDCSVQSNCLSIEPLDTPFGEKRRINQSSCNKDFSCVKGFCPSFVYVEGASLRKAATISLDLAGMAERLPAVQPSSLREPVNLLVAGIGGMGVTTVAAVLAMAAHIQGLQASTLDMTGLAQKGGPVTSHVRFAATDAQIEGPRVPTGTLDVLLASDMLVAAKAEQLALLNSSRTLALANGQVAPTSEFVMKQRQSYDTSAMVRALEEGAKRFVHHDMARIAEQLFGDMIFANMMLVGMAYQAGALPLSQEGIFAAIELNGAAAQQNQRAFLAGRVLMAQPGEILQALPKGEAQAALGLKELIKFYQQELEAYQDTAYGRRYRRLLDKLRERDAEFGLGTMELTRTAAEMLYKVMAYKDEYEVARLYADPAFKQKLMAQFEQPRKLKVMLAPPLWPLGKDKKTGRPKKLAFGPWVFSAFKLLAKGKWLRGKAYDPFGHTQERRDERQLMRRFERDVIRVTGRVGVANYGLLVDLMRVPDSVRGFGVVKAQSLSAAAQRRQKLIALLQDDPTTVPFKEAAE